MEFMLPFFTIDEIRKSPTNKPLSFFRFSHLHDEVVYQLERLKRAFYLQEERVVLPDDCIFLTIELIFRLYIQYDLNEIEPWDGLAGCLFLALKIREIPCRISLIVKNLYRFRGIDDVKAKKKILNIEDILLDKVLNFEYYEIRSPLTVLDDVRHELHISHDTERKVMSVLKDIYYHTTLFLQFSSYELIYGAIYFAQITIYKSNWRKHRQYQTAKKMESVFLDKLYNACDK